MLEILNFFNYNPPNISVSLDENTAKFGSTGYNNLFEIKLIDNAYVLFVNGQQWMMYEKDNHFQASQLFAHYYIAYGDVIVTGLGLGIRENWLLNNPKVKSLTIIERNEEIINYHKKHNPIFFEKANIINCDASDYKGKCDTLLLDHFEFEPIEEIIYNVIKICQNIECENMWFWSLETLILANIHNINQSEICDKFRKGQFKINIEWTHKNIKKVYDLIKENLYLNKLPNLKIEELQLIISIYTHFFTRL